MYGHSLAAADRREWPSSPSRAVAQMPRVSLALARVNASGAGGQPWGLLALSQRNPGEMALCRCIVSGICALMVTASAGAAVASPGSALLPPPVFRASPYWVTVTTGPTNPRRVPPQVWAITVRSNVGALVPFGLFNGLRRLSRNGVLIWATTSGRGGPTKVYTRARWPLQVASSFRVDRTWEGQVARNVQQRLRWASVSGWRLDVRVYFGTQHPSKKLLRRTQAELERLQLPGSS